MTVPAQRTAQTPVEPVPRYLFLDTYVEGYSVGTLLARLGCAVADKSMFVFQHHNSHSLALMQGDPALRTSYAAADSIFIDGIGAILVARALGASVSSKQRVAVLDWIWPLFETAESEGWHIVHLGGSTSMLTAATAAVKARCPAMRFSTVDGYFDPADPVQNDAVLNTLRGLAPTILLVGMGMPRQEKWLLDNVAALPPCVAVTVGGILGFVSGANPTPPRWIGRLGLEWLFRLVTEPRRLWHRYLVEPLPLVPLVLRQRLAQRRCAR